MRYAVASLVALVSALSLSGCVLPGPAIYMEGQHADLENRLSGSGVDLIHKADSVTVRLPDDVVFAIDQADIEERFEPVLESLAESINNYPETRVEVIGYADTTGTPAHNQTLSENRAASVAAYLVNQGVAKERFVVIGRGQRDPIASNKTEEGRAKNRRVEVILRSPKPAKR